MIESTLWIALGGALGSIGRYWLGLAFEAAAATGFPWATLAANVSGSLAIGAVAALQMSPALAQFLMVGVLGGYTTFSAFSLQTLSLVQAGDWPKAAANVLGSVVLCLAAVWIGHALAGSFKGGEA
jgi:fluoride exporter